VCVVAIVVVAVFCPPAAAAAVPWLIPVLGTIAGGAVIGGTIDAVANGAGTVEFCNNINPAADFTADSSTVVHTNNVTLPKVAPPRHPGYKFLGYYAVQDQQEGTGLGCIKKDALVYDENGNALYSYDFFANQFYLQVRAKWEPCTYFIIFDLNGGVSADIDGTKSLKVSIAYDSSLAAFGDQNIVVPTRDGYIFQGYYSQPIVINSKMYFDKDGKILWQPGLDDGFYQGAGSVYKWVGTKDLTLYAIWKQV